MGLFPSDPLPQDISVTEAYTEIRNWCRRHASKPPHLCADYWAKSVRLIQSLPPADQLSELEQLAVLKEVFWGLLEWAYHESNGRFKMAAYAQAAYDTIGKNRFGRLTETELAELNRGSLGGVLSLR